MRDCRQFQLGLFAMLAVCTVMLETARAQSPDSTPSNEQFAPSDHYVARDIQGWRVLVNKDFLRDEAALCQQTLTLLRHQLYQIVRVVPGDANAKLRKITIWVEQAEPHHACMAYHPDAAWLREHDMNPDKQHCVELANARNFLTWTIDQPWMVFHELAHGYHHQFLGGFDNAEILASYRRAMEAKSYDSVLRISGRREKAYATTNQMEYFAELSEAFFGTNDFFPFVRSELKQHDPGAYEVLQQVWRGER